MLALQRRLCDGLSCVSSHNLSSPGTILFSYQVHQYDAIYRVQQDEIFKTFDSHCLFMLPSCIHDIRQICYTMHCFCGLRFRKRNKISFAESTKCDPHSSERRKRSRRLAAGTNRRTTKGSKVAKSLAGARSLNNVLLILHHVKK